MKVDIRSLGASLASLVWVALRSFLATVFALTLIGGILAGLSYYFLRDHYWLYGASAAAAALIESVATGVFLGVKQAMVGAMAHGLGKLRLGRSFVGLIFDRMLRLAGSGKGSEGGGQMVLGLERLPLAQAEELLSGAVRDVTGDAAQGGWLRRRIQSRLLEAVRKYTLARFRDEGATQGGIDLLRVKAELEERVDDAVVQRVRGGLRLWTALVIVGLPLVVAGQTWLVLLLMQPPAH